MKKTYLIFGTMVVSFGITLLLSKEVFLSNTPRMSPVFFSKILNKSPKTNQAINVNNETLLQFKEAYTKPLNKVASGVYAREDQKTVYIQVKDSEINYETMTLRTKSGKTVTLKYSKDNPPVKEMIDLIKSE